MFVTNLMILMRIHACRVHLATVKSSTAAVYVYQTSNSNVALMSFTKLTVMSVRSFRVHY